MLRTADNEVRWHGATVCDSLIDVTLLSCVKLIELNVEFTNINFGRGICPIVYTLRNSRNDGQASNTYFVALPLCVQFDPDGDGHIFLASSATSTLSSYGYSFQSCIKHSFVPFYNIEILKVSKQRWICIIGASSLSTFDATILRF